MFVKVIVALAVVFVGMGLVVKGVGAHVGSLVRSPIDLSLTQDVTDHAWTPVLKGHPAPGQRLSFGAGQVHSAACKGDLGTYSLHIDHRFSFQPAARLRGRPTDAAHPRPRHEGDGQHARAATRCWCSARDDRTLLTLRARG